MFYDEIPSLLLLDLKLPDLDGIEILRIFKNKFGDRLPIIVTSEMDEALKYQLNALKIAADYHFLKNNSDEDMASVILNTLVQSEGDTAVSRLTPPVMKAGHIQELIKSGSLTETSFDRRQARFSGFKIIEMLGSGGMANVYRALRAIDNEEVALKVLSRRHSGNDMYVKRFLREASVMSAIDHPSIVKVLDQSGTDYFYYIVMELVEGKSLLKAIEDESIKPSDYRDLVAQLADPLSFLHSLNMVHRDVKPGNYLINDDGKVKLSDFGLVRAEDDFRLTADSSMLGSFAYVSPEQKRDASKVDYRTDIYSLGITYYELFVGDVPELKIAKPSEVNPACLPVMDEVLERAFDSEPDKRHISVNSLRDEVLAALSKEP
jgi:serine/threonine-protein kinase